MKKSLLLILIWLTARGHAQIAATVRLEVGLYKTTSLVFASAILSVDRGSEQIIVQKATDNVLKVKAVTRDFNETSLTVITAEGRIYPFVVGYCDSPQVLTISFDGPASIKPLNRYDSICARVMPLKPELWGSRYASGKVNFQMLGWYIHGNLLYCKLKLENRSPISYDIDQFHVYLRDKTIAKRTAVQETIIRPLCVYGDTGTISARSSRLLVLGFQKFTLSNDRHFEIEILERNGDRHLVIKSSGRHLMLAKAF